MSAILFRLVLLLALLAGPPAVADAVDGEGHDCCVNAMVLVISGGDGEQAPACGSSHCTVCAAMAVDIDAGTGFADHAIARAAFKPTPPSGRAHDAPPAPPPRRA